MDIFEAIKMLFTSDSMAAIITLLGAGVYIGFVMPDRKELLKYREDTHQKLEDIVSRDIMTTIVRDAVKLENQALGHEMIESITLEIVAKLTENREYYAKLAGEKAVGINENIALLTTELTQLNNYLQEQDICKETLSTELSETVQCVDVMYQLLNNLVIQLENKKMIDPIDRSNLQMTRITSNELNAFTTLMDKVMSRQGATKLNRVLGQKGRDNQR